jgi:hypothetical protein
MPDNTVPDFSDASSCLASAVAWASKLPLDVNIVVVSFGRRCVDAKGWYWYARTDTAWNNGMPASRRETFERMVGRITDSWMVAVDEEAENAG